MFSRKNFSTFMFCGPKSKFLAMPLKAVLVNLNLGRRRPPSTEALVTLLVIKVFIFFPVKTEAHRIDAGLGLPAHSDCKT